MIPAVSVAVRVVTEASEGICQSRLPLLPVSSLCVRASEGIRGTTRGIRKQAWFWFHILFSPTEVYVCVCVWGGPDCLFTQYHDHSHQTSPSFTVDDSLPLPLAQTELLSDSECTWRCHLLRSGIWNMHAPRCEPPAAPAVFWGGRVSIEMKHDICTMTSAAIRGMTRTVAHLLITWPIVGGCVGGREAALLYWSAPTINSKGIN